MKFLLVDSDQDHLDLMATLLEEFFDNIMIFTANSGENALNVLKREENIVLVISDYNMPNGNGDIIQKYIIEKNLKIPFVLWSSLDYDHIERNFSKKPDLILDRPINIEQVKNELATMFILKHKKPQLKRSKEEREFCRISVNRLLKLYVLPQDVYIKINHDKFIKVGFKNDIFESEDLKRYEGKDVEYLYIKKDKFYAFINNAQAEIAKLNHLTSVLENTPETIPASANNLVREFYHKFGFTDDMTGMIKDSIDITMRTIRCQPELKDLIERFRKSEESYLQNHSILLAHVCCLFATQLKWHSDATFKKLSFAAFLHDITLYDLTFEEIIKLDKKLQSEEKNKIDVLGYETLRQYHNHPIHAADIFNKIKDPIPEVHTIIAQHHELPDGQGFPHSLNALSIFPLSALFIVSHHLVDAFMANRDNFDPVHFLNSLDPSFHKGNFKTITQTLIEYLVKTNLKF